MITPDISIIIPVFNAEKTLNQCINSVLQQTIPNFEIICIDDGSTDSSVEQIKSMQEQHPQIHLMQQEHGGAGPARNLGIQSAKGKYIAFLDADDEFMEPNALNTMVHACLKNQANICGSYRILCENGKECETGVLKDYKVPEKGCFIEYRDLQYDYDYQSYIYNREFLLQNNIWFPPYMRYQDPPFFVKAMAIAERFYVMPTVLYRYHFDSQKHTLVTKYVDHILRGILDTLQIAKNKEYSRLFENIIVRVEWEYHDAILQNLSEKSMPLLVAVNELYQQYQGKELVILSEIYRSIQSVGKLIYSHDLLRKIVLIKQKGNGFQSYFTRNGIQTAAVYGLGAYGELLINELEICGIKIVCGIDRNVTAYRDLSVISPDEDVPECDVLIVSLMEPEEIAHHYEKTGNVRVLTFTEIVGEIEKGMQGLSEAL